MLSCDQRFHWTSFHLFVKRLGTIAALVGRHSGFKSIDTPDQSLRQWVVTNLTRIGKVNIMK